jgi:ATP adenylyltransferase
MLKSLSKPLPDLVDVKYASAKASDSLMFASSSLAILHTDSGLPVRKYNQFANYDSRC